MNVHSSPKEARRSSDWFDGLPDAIEHAFSQLEIEHTKAYSVLCELAAGVRVEGHSIDAESAVIDAGRWIAPGTIYVTLIYDPNSIDPVELSDSYPITIVFTVNGTAVEITDVTADTSSFYE